MKRAIPSMLIVSLFCILAASNHATLRAESLFGITDSNQLVTIDGLTGMVSSATSVTGLGGASLIGIDIRPSTGELYGYSSGDQFFRINTGSGAATAVGGALGLIDSVQSFDFDPVTDQIRLLTNWRKNIRVNPNTGGVISNDALLAYAGGDVNSGDSPQVVQGAYTNSYPGAASTTLYNLEATNDVLTIQSPENTGTLNTVGSLGMPLGTLLSVNGMDISGTTGTAYVVGSSNLGNGLQANTLYTVNLATGEIEMVAPIQNLALAPLNLGADLGGSGHNSGFGSGFGSGLNGGSGHGSGWNDGFGDGSGWHDSGWYDGQWCNGGWNDEHGSGGHGSGGHGDDFGMIVDVAAPIGVPVPEPSTFVLAACGGIGLVVLARRRVARKK